MKRKIPSVVLVGGLVLLFITILLFWCFGNRKNLVVNESPPDYIECTVMNVDKQQLLTKVLNDKSFHYKPNETVTLDCSIVRDENGDLLGESEIEEFLRQFEIGDNISVKFKVIDAFEPTPGARGIKVPYTDAINGL